MKRTGQVTRLKNGKYQIRVQSKKSDGTRKSVSQIIYGTRDDAKDALKTLLSDIAEKERQPKLSQTGKTFDELFDAYLEIIKPTVRQQSYEQYVRFIKCYLRPEFGARLVTDLETLEIERFYVRLRKKLAPVTIIKIHTQFKAALKKAKRWKWIRENPIADVSPPRMVKTERDTLTPDELNRFFEHCPNFACKVQWMFFALTGARAGEVLGARWSDIDFQQQTFSVRQVLVRIKGKKKFDEPKTKNSKRIILLPDTLIELLKALQTEQHLTKLRLGAKWIDYDLIFPTSIGTPQNPGNIGRVVAEIKTDAEINKRISPHSFRRTFATLGRRLNLNRKAVTDVLGHATDTFTDYAYVYTNLDDRRIVTDTIAEAILKNVSSDVSLTQNANGKDLLN